MHVLVIAPHAYYIDRGSPMDLDILLKALSARGETVDALVYRYGEERDYPGVSIHRIGTPRFIGKVKPGFSLRKLLSDLFLFFKARSLARNNTYQVVHAVEEAVFIAMWLKRSYGLQYVYDMDSSIAQQMVEQLPFLKPLAHFFGWSEGLALKGCLAAAPVCFALADIAIRGGAKKIVPLHDISQLELGEEREELRARLGLEGKLALYVGNLQPYQGIDLLLESFVFALEEAADLNLVIAGGAKRDIAKYEAKARRLGVEHKTHFLGPWPVAELGGLLGAADILVAPRVKGVNTPMKIFPYLHSGRAVLVTDLITHNQLLSDEVAYLAEAEPRPFGAALAELARDGELRDRLGRAGRRFVERDHVFEAHQRRVDRLYDWVTESIEERNGVSAGHGTEPSLDTERLVKRRE